MKHPITNITLIVLFFLAASLAERLARMSAVALSSLRGLGRVGQNSKLKGA